MTVDDLEQGHRPNIKKFTDNVRRYRKMFLIIFTAVLASAIFWIVVQEPLFEATAQIEIQSDVRAPLPSSESVPAFAGRDGDLVDTQVAVMHNRALARRVVMATKFQPGGVTADGPGEIEMAIDELMNKLLVSRSGETRVINIIYESSNATRAAEIANAFAENYLTMQVELKEDTTRKTNELLASRIEEMSTAVEIAERDVQQYKIGNAMMSVNGATLAEQSIAAIDSELARSRADETAAYGRLRAAVSAGARQAAAATPALEQLLSRQTAAKQEWQQAQEKLGELHPDYQAANLNLEELNQAVRRETSRARLALSARRQQEIDGLRAEARAASRRRGSLDKSVNATKAALASTNHAQVRLDALERKAQAVRATYEAYLSRYQETSSNLGTEQPDARIISKAMPPPSPSSPRVFLNLLLGLLLALAFGISGVATTSLLKNEPT